MAASTSTERAARCNLRGNLPSQRRQEQHGFNACLLHRQVEAAGPAESAFPREAAKARARGSVAR